MSLTPPINIFQRYCNDGVDGVDYEIPPITGADTSIVSQPLGAPPIMEEPITAGGLAILRKQFNGSIRLYSEFILWLVNGGYFTFDPTVSTENGGYPDGAILFDVTNYKFVISLHDNNTENFVSDPSKINGVDWQYTSVIDFPDITDAAGVVNIGLTSSNGIIRTTNGQTRGTMPNAGTTNNNIATVGDVNAVGAGFLSLALSNSNSNGLMLTGNISGGSPGGNVLVTQFLRANIGDIPTIGTSHTFTLMQSILTSNFPSAIIPFIFDDTGTVWGGIESLTIVGSNITQVTVFLRETSSVTQSVSLGLYIVGYKLP